MRNLVDLVAFEIGQQYENRKGKYEVLEMEGDTMRIRWGDGEEITTSVTMQSHIINQIRYNLEHPSLNKSTPPRKESLAPKRLASRLALKRGAVQELRKHPPITYKWPTPVNE